MNKNYLKRKIDTRPRNSERHQQIQAYATLQLRSIDHSTKNETDFINCQAWKGTADFICDYFAKGQEILLDGEEYILTSGIRTEKHDTQQELLPIM